jgi:hypothetical protein
MLYLPFISLVCRLRWKVIHKIDPRWLQETFDVPLVIQLTDDEKFLFKDLTKQVRTNKLIRLDQQVF